MPRSSQLIACLALNICTILAACSVQPAQDAGKVSQQPATPIAITTQPDLVSAGEKEDQYEVYAWVDKPTPLQGEMVILFGNLKKNGVILGGIMMEAMWSGEAQDRGLPSCYIMVLYQRGLCFIDTTDFPVGESVPLTVKFRYNELILTDETSITVR